MPLIFCLILLSGAAVAAELDQPLPPYSSHFDPRRDPFVDGHEAIKLARQSGRRVLIELGGDWCKWCHVMDDFLADNPDVQACLRRTFVLLKVNVSDANDNAKFLAAFPRPLGYPHMYIADNTGKLLKSKDTGEFFHKGKYSRERFMAFCEKWQIPPASSPADNTTVNSTP